MAYEKPRSRRDLGGSFSDDPHAKTLQKLGDVVSDLYMSPEPNDLNRLWNSAQRLLQKTKADPERIATVIKQRRPGALSTLVKELTLGISAPAPAQSKPTPTVTALENAQPGQNDSSASTHAAVAPASPSSSASAGPSSAQLKSAMKAFRKRLKLTKLDEESRLSNRAMTGGHKSAVVAIMPPREYPDPVWEELARQGKLRKAGNGFYELTEQV